MVGVRGPLKPRIYSAAGPKSPRREQNAQQIGVNRPATSILNARFIVWRQTPARYNWPLIRVRQKVNSSLGRAFPPPSFSFLLFSSSSSSLLFFSSLFLLFSFFLRRVGTMTGIIRVSSRCYQLRPSSDVTLRISKRFVS